MIEVMVTPEMTKIIVNIETCQNSYPLTSKEEKVKEQERNEMYLKQKYTGELKCRQRKQITELPSIGKIKLLVVIWHRPPCYSTMSFT